MSRASEYTGPPDYDLGSWQALVTDHLQGNQIVNARFWGALQRSAFDSEMGQVVRSTSNVPDTVFFEHLANSNDGTYTFMTMTIQRPSLFPTSKPRPPLSGHPTPND